MCTHARRAPSARLSVVALLLVVSLVGPLAACTNGRRTTLRPAPTRPTKPRKTPSTKKPPTSAAVGHLDWHACKEARGFECATLRVPLDYENPAGKTIELALTRLAAREGAERVGSLLVNPGGPGGSGVEFLQDSGRQLFGSLRSDFDIVAWDPRGVGASTPVRCVDDLGEFIAVDPSPDTPEERQALLDANRRFDEGCQAKSGELLPFVGTKDAARDMDRIREALGDEKLTYMGFSYGTLLGATYAELFPKDVRALVLDGAVNPALDPIESTRQQTLGFERALDAFLADCAARRSCAFHSSGDPGAALDKILADVETEPLPTSDGDRSVGPGELYLAIAAALYDEESGWPALAMALGQAADDEDGTTLLMLSDLYTEREGDGTYSNSIEALNAVNCVDNQSPSDPAVYDALAERLRSEAPHFGLASAYGGLTCALWPVPAKGKPGPITAAGAPPILVVGTTGDPATPYAWAQALAEQLQSGVLLTYEGEGHTAFGGKSDCIDKAVTGYLVDLRVPADGTRC